MGTIRSMTCGCGKRFTPILGATIKMASDNTGRAQCLECWEEEREHGKPFAGDRRELIAWLAEERAARRRSQPPKK